MPHSIDTLLVGTARPNICKCSFCVCAKTFEHVHPCTFVLVKDAASGSVSPVNVRFTPDSDINAQSGMSALGQ